MVKETTVFSENNISFVFKLACFKSKNILKQHQEESGPKVIKHFMLNSTEQEISTAHKN